MKFLVFVVFLVGAQDATAQRFSPNCSALASGKTPTWNQKPMTLYLVAKEKKPDSSKCINIKITGSGKQITLNNSMVFNGEILNTVYNANANSDGRWNVTQHGTKNGIENGFMIFKILLRR